MSEPAIVGSTLLKLLLNAVVAWIPGLLFIAGNLYVSNNGADFTWIDLTGFGVITNFIFYTVVL